MTITTHTSPARAEDITEEMIDLVAAIIEGWYPVGNIDWEDVWDRADGSPLDDGTRLDLGTDLNGPALKKLKKDARARVCG